jgi:hypothetical protein
MGYVSSLKPAMEAIGLMNIKESTRTSSRIRLGITLVAVAFMISSSPIFNIINPATLSASRIPSPSATPSATSPSTISQDGSDFTAQAAISSLTSRPTNNIVNTHSFYDIVFLTSTSGTIKTIQVTFPAGTTIPSGAFFNEAEGIGPGTASKSGQTITYTVTNAVNVPAGTKIRLEFANINNPLNPSANYKVTVTTRNAANAIIDGPTQSTAYTMKQIGTNAIADNSITSSKPAASLMKKVILSDDAAGNALGWNPNGATTSFVIDETAIPQSGAITSFISIIVIDNIGTTPENYFCDVVRLTPSAQEFSIACSLPPNEVDELHYVIENLPPHIP